MIPKTSAIREMEYSSISLCYDFLVRLHYLPVVS